MRQSLRTLGWIGTAMISVVLGSTVASTLGLVDLDFEDLAALLAPAAAQAQQPGGPSIGVPAPIPESRWSDDGADEFSQEPAEPQRIDRGSTAPRRMAKAPRSSQQPTLAVRPPGSTDHATRRRAAVTQPSADQFEMMDAAPEMPRTPGRPYNARLPQASGPISMRQPTPAVRQTPTPAKRLNTPPVQETPVDDHRFDEDDRFDEIDDRFEDLPESSTEQTPHVARMPQPIPQESFDADNSLSTPSEPFSEPVGREQILPDAAPQSAPRSSNGQGVMLEWVIPPHINLDQETACQLVVRNATPTDVCDVVVQVSLPDQVELNHAEPAPRSEGRQFLWRLPNMASQEVHRIQLSLVATSSGNLAPRATVTFSQAAEANVRIVEPRLEITIKGPEQAIVGQQDIWELEVRNHGDGATANVVVRALLDQSLQHARGRKLEYGIGGLGPGEARSIRIPLTGIEPGSYRLEATVNHAAKVLAQATCSVDVVRPTVELTVEGPKLRYVDRKATYVMTIENPGPAPADNVQVQCVVPEGFAFSQASAGGQFDETQSLVTWFVGHLEPQETAHVGVQLVATQPGNHHVVAEVHADSDVMSQAEATTQVEGISSIVMDIVESDDPVEVAGETTYEIRLANSGSRPSSNVQVMATLPASMQAIDVQGPTDGRISKDRIQFAPLERLEPGANAIYRVRVLCKQAGDVTFRASFTCDEQRQPTNAEESTRVYLD